RLDQAGREDGAERPADRRARSSSAGAEPRAPGQLPGFGAGARSQVSSCSLIQLSLTLASRVCRSWRSPRRTKVSRAWNSRAYRWAVPSKTSLSACQPAEDWVTMPLELSTVVDAKVCC